MNKNRRRKYHSNQIVQGKVIPAVLSASEMVITPMMASQILPTEMAEPPAQSTTAIIMNAPCTYRIIPSDMLRVDERYQRKLNMKRVAQIAENYDPRIANAIKVSFRDGAYWIFDGNHTLNAQLMLNGDKPFPAACKVFTGLTFEDEAYLFALQTGESKDVAFSARLRAMMQAGNPRFEAFRRHTENAGMKVSLTNQPGKNTIAAIDKAFKLYEKYGAEDYEYVLRLIKDAWDGAAWSLMANMLGGAMLLYTRYRNDFKRERFIREASKTDETTVRRKASNPHHTRDVAFAYALCQIYNSRGGNGSLKLSQLTWIDG